MPRLLLFAKNASHIAWLLATASLAFAAEAPHVASAASSPEALFTRAVALFFDGRPKESAQLFDDLVEARPELAPELWQRGLALYYSDRFQDGRRQFELHRTVNPNDVENPAWHYLCLARAATPEEARKAMLPVGQDSRVPMREILALYKGEGSEEHVLAAASRGEGQTLHNQLCYAHLYLGLHAEAQGDTMKARKHILLAAGPYSMDHFMGRVAKVHAQIRGWSLAAEPAPNDLQGGVRQ